MNSFRQDLRYAVRMLLKKPAFTMLAVLTLTLGISASVAIFSIMDGFFLRPLPGKNNENLVVVAVRQSHRNFESPLSYPDFLDYQANSDAFSAMAGYVNSVTDLKADGRSELVLTHFVTSNFFETLGLQPALGRFFLAGEGDRAATAPYIVLNYDFWQERFAANPSIVGHAVTIDGTPFTIVGVAPKGFMGPYKLIETQMYVPIGMAERLAEPGPQLLTARDSYMVHTLARPKPGVTREQARVSLQLVADRLSREYPLTNKDTRVGVYPERLARPEPGAVAGNVLVIGVFLAMVALALMVTCINVANLVLVRASGRAKELALRSALGAGRFRIVRQLLTESLMLAALGGIGGGAVGALLARLATSIRMPGGLPFYFEFDFDWRVFLGTGGIVALCTVLVGLLPALRATRLDLNATLRESGKSDSAGGFRHRLRHALVVVQVAGSIVVLIAAGLFVRSLQVAQKMNLGFRAQGMLNLTFNPGLMGYDSARTTAFYQSLKQRVSALPGVESASFASSVPMGFDNESAKVWKEGQSTTERPADDGFNRVDEDFFRTMSVTILEGRAFTAQDSKDSTPVAIVNQEMAKRLWPGQDALGHHFRYGADARAVDVVGVTANGKYNWLFEDQTPFFYVPMAQAAYHSVSVLQVRTATPPLELAAAIESAARETDPNVPPFAVATMEESLGGPNGFFLIRTGAIFAGFIGALCLFLAVIGVYGVISYAANQRTHEIGVRMALGAQRGNVLRMVMRQGLVLVSIGLVLGLGASLAVTRFMRDLLFQIGAMDPVTFGGVSLILVGVAMIACYVPARRATKVDPLIALRYE